MISTEQFLIILALLTAFYAIKRYFDSIEKSRDLVMLELQLKTNIDPNIVNQLDDFIAEIMDDYLLTSTNYIQKEYISEQDEIEMRNAIIEEIGNRLSPYMYQKLSVYYNEKEIPNIIANKVFQLVTAFVIQHNTPKQTKEEL